LVRVSREFSGRRFDAAPRIDGNVLNIGDDRNMRIRQVGLIMETAAQNFIVMYALLGRRRLTGCDIDPNGLPLFSILNSAWRGRYIPQCPCPSPAGKLSRLDGPAKLRELMVPGQGPGDKGEGLRQYKRERGREQAIQHAGPGPGTE
jgi:hypothetical protein